MPFFFSKIPSLSHCPKGFGGSLAAAFRANFAVWEAMSHKSMWQGLGQPRLEPCMSLVAKPSTAG